MFLVTFKKTTNDVNAAHDEATVMAGFILNCSAFQKSAALLAVKFGVFQINLNQTHSNLLYEENNPGLTDNPSL